MLIPVPTESDIGGEDLVRPEIGVGQPGGEDLAAQAQPAVSESDFPRAQPEAAGADVERPERRDDPPAGDPLVRQQVRGLRVARAKKASMTADRVLCKQNCLGHASRGLHGSTTIYAFLTARLT
jgi:hypothetical protein